MLYDTGSFIVYIKIDDIYKDIAEDVDSSHYELEIDHCLMEKIKKVIGLMKDKFGGKIMTKFVGLRAKTYKYSIDDGNESKKAKGTKKCVMKRKIFKLLSYFSYIKLRL